MVLRMVMTMINHHRLILVGRLLVIQRVTMNLLPDSQLAPRQAYLRSMLPKICGRNGSTKPWNSSSPCNRLLIDTLRESRNRKESVLEPFLTNLETLPGCGVSNNYWYLYNTDSNLLGPLLGSPTMEATISIHE